MSLEILHNYPSGCGKEHLCPYSDLVEICNSLSGLKVAPEEFCTETVENAQYSRGIISNLKSADLHPSASCARSNKLLLEQLETVGKIASLPSENEYMKRLQQAGNIEVVVGIASAYNVQKGAYEERKSIIKRWREVIFKTCCSTTDDKENHHFRRFSSENELTEEEIIGKVKQFSEALEEIVGYERKSVWWYLNQAKNCNRSPQQHRFSF
jgi:hypothetical protein